MWLWAIVVVLALGGGAAGVVGTLMMLERAPAGEGAETTPAVTTPAVGDPSTGVPSPVMPVPSIHGAEEDKDAGPPTAAGTDAGKPDPRAGRRSRRGGRAAMGTTSSETAMSESDPDPEPQPSTPSSSPAEDAPMGAPVAMATMMGGTTSVTIEVPEESPERRRCTTDCSRQRHLCLFPRGEAPMTSSMRSMECHQQWMGCLRACPD